MNLDEALALLKQERPELIEHLRAALAPPIDDKRRAALNGLLLNLFDMQALIARKRALAATLITMSPGLNPRQQLKHIPDVIIRQLCQIAEIQRTTVASDEWLDKMYDRCEDRTKQPGYGHGPED